MRVHHLLPGLLLLASCSSEPSQTVIGTWMGRSGDFQLTSTFAADGTLIESADSGRGPTTRNGSWRIEGDRLFIKTVIVTGAGANGREFEESVYITADKLVREAFVPVGSHDGVVGTWRRSLSNKDWDPATDVLGQQLTLDGTLTLRRDGTSRMELRGFEAPRIIEGSYTVSASGDIELSVSREDDNTFQMFPLHLIDDAVLGSTVMTRQ